MRPLSRGKLNREWPPANPATKTAISPRMSCGRRTASILGTLPDWAVTARWAATTVTVSTAAGQARAG